MWNIDLKKKKKKKKKIRPTFPIFFLCYANQTIFFLGLTTDHEGYVKEPVWTCVIIVGSHE